ncbi:MAG: hypothetical protein ABJH33_18120, partial [Rhizobiaceae bacterium]
PKSKFAVEYLALEKVTFLHCSQLCPPKITLQEWTTVAQLALSLFTKPVTRQPRNHKSLVNRRFYGYPAQTGSLNLAISKVDGISGS